MTRGLRKIRERIEKGTARVLTAAELKARLRDGEKISSRDVDVVTCGTCGVMSGTAAILSVPVADPGSFIRADRITLNGVPCFPGPCPNERLGIVDVIVYGTSRRSERYGGGHLFRDIVSGATIEVEAESAGRTFTAPVPSSEIPFARLFTTRSAFKNYSAFVHTPPGQVHTIFSVTPLAGRCREATVSGCGEINPLQNDPLLRFLSPGTPLLVNGGRGYVVGTGTRSTPEKPNLSVHADMAGMDPLYCGGFVTSEGPECITTIGTAIPVVDDTVIEALSVLDQHIPLPVVDIKTRSTIATANYADVWEGRSRAVEYHAARCPGCGSCPPREYCPTDAIGEDGEIDEESCVACGTCVAVCTCNAYTGNFGNLTFDGRCVPIVLRQSDRTRAEHICTELKNLIEDRRFPI